MLLAIISQWSLLLVEDSLKLSCRYHSSTNYWIILHIIPYPPSNELHNIKLLLDIKQMACSVPDEYYQDNTHYSGTEEFFYGSIRRTRYYVPCTLFVVTAFLRLVYLRTSETRVLILSAKNNNNNKIMNIKYAHDYLIQSATEYSADSYQNKFHLIFMMIWYFQLILNKTPKIWSLLFQC